MKDREIFEKHKTESCINCINHIRIYPDKWYKLLIKDKCMVTLLPIKGIHLFIERDCDIFRRKTPPDDAKKGGGLIN